MFTGLVETTGRVLTFKRTGAVYTLSIEVQDKASFVPELVLGQSVAVSGACLTVTGLSGQSSFDVEMMPETVTRTWFGDRLKIGQQVNLERALRIGDRLDGHLVLGHVDGIAILRELTGSGKTRIAVFETEKNLARGIVSKGSVALDGVSLTVIDAGKSTFSVGFIPTTLESCTLGKLKVGDTVNLETDILGKYVERLLGAKTDFGAKGLSLNIEELRELGY